MQVIVQSGDGLRPVVAVANDAEVVARMAADVAACEASLAQAQASRDGAEEGSEFEQEAADRVATLTVRLGELQAREVPALLHPGEGQELVTVPGAPPSEYPPETYDYDAAGPAVVLNEGRRAALAAMFEEQAAQAADDEFLGRDPATLTDAELRTLTVKMAQRAGLL